MPFGITKRLGCKGQINGKNGYEIVLSPGEDDAKKVIVSYTKVAIHHLRIRFNDENWLLKTQMWVPHEFVLVQGTQHVIPGSWVPRN